MNINKQEAERILKNVQQNKVTAVTLQKNDTQQNRRQELMRLQRMVETKVLHGEEITVVVVETNQSREYASPTCKQHDFKTCSLSRYDSQLSLLGDI